MKSTPMSNLTDQNSSNNSNNPEEDNTIQDLLQSLNSENYAMPQPPLGSGPMPSSHPSANNVMPDSSSTEPTFAPFAQFEDVGQGAAPFLSQSLSRFDQAQADLKLVAFCIIAFLAASQIPLQKLIGHYMAIDKIPFSDVAIKALLAGAFFYALSKVIT